MVTCHAQTDNIRLRGVPAAAERCRYDTTQGCIYKWLSTFVLWLLPRALGINAHDPRLERLVRCRGTSRSTDPRSVSTVSAVNAIAAVPAPQLGRAVPLIAHVVGSSLRPAPDPRGPWSADLGAEQFNALGLRPARQPVGQLVIDQRRP